MDIRKLVATVLGIDSNCLFGIASLAGLVEPRYAGFRYGIALARPLDPGILTQVRTGPTRAYLDHYRTVNRELETIAAKVADRLVAAGYRALPLHPTADEQTVNTQYRDTLSAPFSHKMAATRAGLGWIGKTDLLVTPEYGPRVRLTTVLLDGEGITAGAPIEASRCGSCRMCADACPGQVANGMAWDTSIHRDSYYDAHSCRETCRAITRKNLGEEISICGICVAVCPVGKKMI